MLKVSILIPCYNVEKFLPHCLDSIIKQTYNDLQIILIDDGSKDNTWGILQEYAAKDSRVEVYHQDNHGVAYTRNQLLDKIKGDYFLFIDSDDWVELGMVEFLLERAKQESADMVTCDAVINDTSVSLIYSEKIYNREQAIKRFLYHIEFRGSLWNKLTNVSLLHNEPRFHRGISYGEDALFCWELLKEANKVIYTDRQFYHYRMNMDSISHGVFGSKKLSGHQVWSTICEDITRMYPQYSLIANARHCIEDTLLLRDAAHCGYQEMDNVKMLQNTVKKYWHCLNKVAITSVKMKIYAFLACRSYWLASKI